MTKTTKTNLQKLLLVLPLAMIYFLLLPGLPTLDSLLYILLLSLPQYLLLAEFSVLPRIDKNGRTIMLVVNLVIVFLGIAAGAVFLEKMEAYMIMLNLMFFISIWVLFQGNYHTEVT